MTLSMHETDAAASGPVPARSGVPVVPARSTARGLGVADVTLDGAGFWGSRQIVNGEATIDHCLEWMERLGWIANFDRVARGEVTVDRAGWQFSDSEIYKLLEAMAWELGRREDAWMEASFSALVARVAAAQDEDGYLGTAFGHPGLPPRYSDLSEGHELYNIGHLLQAAVARWRTRGPDALVEVARRLRHDLEVLRPRWKHRAVEEQDAAGRRQRLHGQHRVGQSRCGDAGSVLVAEIRVQASLHLAGQGLLGDDDNCAHIRSS